MSAERVDHAKEAREWVDAAERPDLSMPETSAFASIAQVHATLALVEQKRIANIIALSVPQDAGTADIRLPSWDEKLQMRPDIREALGLS